MLMSTMLRDNWFNDFWKEFPIGFAPTPPGNVKQDAPVNASTMKTDIKESEDGFEIDMDLPGFKKEDVKAQVKDGYLVVQAETKSENDVKTDDASDAKDEVKYLRRERYYGSCQRSFFVGDAVTEEDIKAKFEDGVLKIAVPKKEKEIEQPKYVAIEG